MVSANMMGLMNTRSNAIICLWSVVLFGAIIDCSPLTSKQDKQLAGTVSQNSQHSVNTLRSLSPTASGGTESQPDSSCKIIRGPVNEPQRSLPLGCRAGAAHTTAKKQPPVDLSKLFKEEVHDYPEDEIKHLLKQTPMEWRELFNVLNTPLDPNNNLTERVAMRLDDYGHTRDESVCRTVTRNIYPREATRVNSLVYIPNNQEFMQVIQAEICQYPDEECDYLKDSLPYGMMSFCQQKYAYKKLLYLDPLEKRMASDMFRYPSCCSCYIRHSSADLRSQAAPNLTESSSHPSISFADKQPGVSGSAIQLSGLTTSQTVPDSGADQASPMHPNAQALTMILQTDGESSATAATNHESSAKEQKREPKALKSDTIITTNSNFENVEGNSGNIHNNNNKPKGASVGRKEHSDQVQGSVSAIEKHTAPPSDQEAESHTQQSAANRKKRLKAAGQTVVLQDDKIYTPNSET